MFGLRSKLFLGFGGLLLITLFIGVQGILRMGELGRSIDVILRENYRSVIAAQDMKESLERMDSAVLFVLLGYGDRGRAQIGQYLEEFDRAMALERKNITLPGEAEAFAALEADYGQYVRVLQTLADSPLPAGENRDRYFGELLPAFDAVKHSANRILDMNQRSMSEANMTAREKAARANQRMYLLLTSGFLLAGLFTWLTGRWILRPITSLTVSANEIARGNMDLVVGGAARDEMGQLARAFNTMAASLRAYRRTNEARLLTLQRATQLALDALDAPIIVAGTDGAVQAVTRAAQTAFHLEVGDDIQEAGPPWMSGLLARALASGRREKLELEDGAGLVQVFAGGEEKFFRPEAVPVLDELGKPAGVSLILHDMTQVRRQDELKRGMVSTVSHQLKTPLTSIRMALYLLLDEKLGPLSPKQEELLVAARDDGDRLLAIVEDLLDLARIQSGRVQMDLRVVDPASLAAHSVGPFMTRAQDGGVTITVSVPPGLPAVRADVTRVPHVFANLMSNALSHTAPGGGITVSAAAEGDSVWFSVSDTGTGIPAELHQRIFEQFFRVPQEGKEAGAGLGLAIAKEIVTAHGGDMRVESRPGHGSTFSFSLGRAADGPPPEEPR